MSFKETKRKGFNFFRSYFDVYNELELDKDKISFIEALLNRQFLGIRPDDLKGMAKFAYISQVNSIDSQVKGFEDKTGIILTPCQGGDVGGRHGGAEPPTLQVEEKGKVQVEEKIENPFSDSFIEIWDQWKEYKKTQFKFTYKALSTEQASITDLLKKSGGDENKAIEIIHQSIANGWKGFFELKSNNNGKSKQSGVSDEELAEALRKKWHSEGRI